MACIGCLGVLGGTGKREMDLLIGPCLWHGDIMTKMTPL